MSTTIDPQELAARQALTSGMAHHDAGRLAEAEAIYRRVLEGAPARADALVLLAGVEHATGRQEEALAHVEAAIRANGKVPHFHNLRGLIHQARGEPERAEAAYRAALAIQSSFPQALFNLGNLMREARRNAEAIACYRRALAAEPRYAAALNNLGVALEDEGRVEEALAAYRAAVALEESPETRMNFARCAAIAPRVPNEAAFRALLARAMDEAWTRPADLARTAATLLRAAGGLAPSPLLLAHLAMAQVCDAALEGSLVRLRRERLEAVAANRDEGGAALELACALARQCFLGDYVFALTAEEAARVDALRRSVEEALAAGSEVRAASLATLAAYVPLGSLAGAGRLADRPWPVPVRALLAQQLDEPRAEATLAERLPTLTPVEGRVSREVRRQYEESPYPRWVACAPAQPGTLQAHLSGLFPHAALPARAAEARPGILVAGCGTGQESIELARRFPEARVLAIDLSRASLAYAERKRIELGIANLEHAQADITALGDIGRFDLVSSVGVLHHLEDPLAGWRRLAATLKPGGYMQVGLYSEAARRDIARARAFIAERGFAPTPQGIREARAALNAAPGFEKVTALRDFHGLNECRDLLFHVQEHRYTLPRIAEMVAELGLEWIGLAVDPATRRRYAERHPDDPWGSDPASWDAFEREFPETFAGMYLFWVAKPVRS
jgi:tetratricopeptide (TPR) repeat protein/SAM-dependent methyltransferase